MAQQLTNVNPADPGAAAPQTPYVSAFAGYQPFLDEKLAPWREVNDEVARIGGQVGIFGGTGHAGHGSAQSVTNTPAPKTPRPIHGPGHRGMTK